MAKKEKKQAGAKSFRKKLTSTLLPQMDGLLKEYEPMMGEKKYAKHLKRTVKSLAAGIASAAKKKKELVLNQELVETNSPVPEEFVKEG